MGFVGALVGQYLTQRGQSESLLQAQKLEAQGAREAALRKLFRASGKLLIDQPLRRASSDVNLRREIPSCAPPELGSARA